MGRLVDEHALAIYRLAVSIVQDPALAEDIVQETVIKAWQSMDTWRGEGSTRSWVLSIAHNTAVSALRRNREQSVAPELMPDRADPFGTERQLDGRERLAELSAALAHLEPLSRSIVVMRDVEGMSYQQIADALEVGLPTVKTRLLRARRDLQHAVLSKEAR